MKGFNWLIVKGHRPMECKVSNPFISVLCTLGNFLETPYHLADILPWKRRGIEQEQRWDEDSRQIAMCLSLQSQAGFCTGSFHSQGWP